MLKSLVKLANRLDSLGLTKEADVIDKEILKLASESSIFDLHDVDASVENLKNIIELTPFERWKYMIKDGSKNLEFLQDMLDGKANDDQKELIEQILQLASEDFEREDEFRDMVDQESEQSYNTLTEDEFEDVIERASDGDRRSLPSYGGRGVSVFQDEMSSSDVISGKRHPDIYIKEHDVDMPSEDDIHVKELDLEKIHGPGMSPSEKSTGKMRPMDESRRVMFDLGLQERLEKLQKGKKLLPEKKKKIEKLKKKISDLKESISDEEDDSVKKELEGNLKNLTRLLNTMISGASAQVDSSGGKLKPLENYTVKDVEPDNYYVIQLLVRPGSKKTFWIAKGEFEDEDSAIEMQNSLEEEAKTKNYDGEIGSVKIIDGLDLKELMSKGEARFRLEKAFEGVKPEKEKLDTTIRTSRPALEDVFVEEPMGFSSGSDVKLSN